MNKTIHTKADWEQRAIAAEQRERIAAETYTGQQQSYRELETLYQAAQERAFRAETDVTALRLWHGTAARSIERLGALIEDIRVGAEQQGHTEVLTKIVTFRAEWGYGEKLLAEFKAARALRAAVQPLGSMAALNQACAAYDKVKSNG